MSDEQSSRRNWWRRGIGAGVCVLPVALASGSIAFGAVRGPAMTPYGLYVVLFAAVIGGFNFWLSLVRPLTYRLGHGSSKGYHFVSGLPIVGTVIVMAGVLLSFGHVATALIGLLVLLMDTAGLPWFLAATWRDRELWDDAPLR